MEIVWSTQVIRPSLGVPGSPRCGTKPLVSRGQHLNFQWSFVRGRSTYKHEVENRLILTVSQVPQSFQKIMSHGKRHFIKGDIPVQARLYESTGSSIQEGGSTGSPPHVYDNPSYFRLLGKGDVAKETFDRAAVIF